MLCFWIEECIKNELPFFFTDINVEHLQLLLFLFHSLPLMQKKSLLLFLAQNIIAVAKIDSRYVLI